MKKTDTYENNTMIKRILVTGSAGFIGSHFADFVLETGNEVIGVDDLSYGKIQNINENQKFYKSDVREYNKIEDIILSEQPDVIAHFAANATTRTSAMGWNNPINDYQINMVGTLNILEVIRKNELDVHVIYASTAAVYGEPEYVPIDEKHPNQPLSPYGISKLAGEKYCQAYWKEWGVKTTIFRIFNTYGPRQPRYVMYEQIKKMLEAPKQIEVLGTGKQLRDYAHISDTVKAIYSAANNVSAIGEVFNVAGGNRISIKELIRIIKSALAIKTPDVYSGKSWKGDIMQLWADTGKIRSILRWAPTMPLEDGINELIDWIKINEKI